MSAPRLVKLAVATVFVTLLAMAAPPHLRSALAGIRGEQAAEAVAEALAEGRALAVRRGRVVSVSLSPGRRLVEVEGGRWHQIPSGIALSGPPAGPDGSLAIRFHPDGTSSGGQIVVSSQGRAWSVMVEGPTGKVRRVSAVLR